MFVYCQTIPTLYLLRIKHDSQRCSHTTKINIYYIIVNHKNPMLTSNYHLGSLTFPIYQTAPTGRTWLWLHQAGGASNCQSGVCHLDRDQSLTVDSWSFVCSSRCTAALVVFVVSMLELFIKTIKKT